MLCEFCERRSSHTMAPNTKKLFPILPITSLSQFERFRRRYLSTNRWVAGPYRARTASVDVEQICRHDSIASSLCTPSITFVEISAPQRLFIDGETDTESDDEKEVSEHLLVRQTIKACEKESFVRKLCKSALGRKDSTAVDINTEILPQTAHTFRPFEGPSSRGKLELKTNVTTVAPQEPQLKVKVSVPTFTFETGTNLRSTTRPIISTLSNPAATTTTTQTITVAWPYESTTRGTTIRKSVFSECLNDETIKPLSLDLVCDPLAAARFSVAAGYRLQSLQAHNQLPDFSTRLLQSTDLMLNSARADGERDAKPSF
jgi:hypothetical protein